MVLVHGTFEDMSDNWQALSPLLYDNGYCVFALNYGSYNGSGPFGVYGDGRDRAVRGPARDVRQTRCSAATGASKVDIVGHSQGGMMPRYYIKYGGASKVHALVGLAPSNHGTTLDGLFTWRALSRREQSAPRRLPRLPASRRPGRRSSPALNAGGETTDVTTR